MIRAPYSQSSWGDPQLALAHAYRLTLEGLTKR